MTQAAPPESTRAARASRSAPADSSVFVREGQAWSELAQLEGESYRLRLGGPFRPAWMAALGGGLAERRVSIDHVHAKRAHDGAWIAELSLVALHGATDPRGISYIRLASEGRTPALISVVIARYELADEADGTLLLRFEAEDTLGLLGSLSAALATLSLFPVEMHIETRDGRAYDCLWLAGAGLTRPSAEARRALETFLRESLSR